MKSIRLHRVPPSSSNDYEQLNFFKSFISQHPRLKRSEEEWYIYRFRFAYDVREQLSFEKQRVHNEISKTPSGIEQMNLHQELKEIQYMLDNHIEIKKIDLYRNTLIEHNLKLIIKIAMNYSRRSNLSLEDLIQEGTFGFIRAIEKFDPRSNTKLGTYAVWWIRQKITRAMSNKSRLVKLPVYIVSAITKVINTIQGLESNPEYPQFTNISLETVYSKDLEKEDYDQLMNILCAKTGFNLVKLNKLLKIMQNGWTTTQLSPSVSSMSTLIDNSFETRLIDGFEKEDIIDDINQSFTDLDELSQAVLKYRFGWSEIHDRSSFKKMIQLLKEDNLYPIKRKKQPHPNTLIDAAWKNLLKLYIK